MTSVSSTQLVVQSASSVIPRGSASSTHRSLCSKGNNDLTPVEGKDGSILPRIKSQSKSSVSDGWGSSVQKLQASGDHTCDYLPEELLLVLTQPPPPAVDLGPPTRHRNLNVSNVLPRKPPANVWHFSKQREKLQHLTKSTPCVCGAGQDISFLYDVPKPDPILRPREAIPNDASAVRTEDQGLSRVKKHIQLPDTLIPEEFHIVKSKGVVGLELEQDQYTVVPKDHENHMVLFPSMNPVSRFEVIQLKKTLHDMLDRAGLNDLDEELKGPSQMHKLIELIKKEQNIYNVIFHELIRQVSIECIERGELLAEVRKRYSDLFSRVPLQVKSLHEEVLAQRALDRRLTEELFQFKSTIIDLTSELAAVKEHDKAVTRQAVKAQDELKDALAEAHRNSNLLSDYQELYEMQRRRLEKEVKSLNEETELWCNACYTLANKVMEEYSLNSAKKLCVVERCWHKLASHFTVVLGERDTSDLTALQSLTDQWRDQVDQFYLDLKDTEEEMRRQMQTVVNDLRRWHKMFSGKLRNKDGNTTLVPDKDKLQQLLKDMKYWQQVLFSINDKFGGDIVLNNLEVLKDSQVKVSQWTNRAAVIFNRHLPAGGATHPCQTLMADTSQLIGVLLKQFQCRVTGENGVVGGLQHVANNIEAWDIRLNTCINDQVTLTPVQWTQFYDLFEDWSVVLTEAIENVGSSTPDESGTKGEIPIVEMLEVHRAVTKWMTSATHSVDSEDAKLTDQVHTLHRALIHWMTQALMGLAPDRKQMSAEAREAGLLYRMTKSELQDKAKTIALQLNEFTGYIVQCCSLFVSQEMQRKTESREENADLEHKELCQLSMECDDWIRTSQLVLSELTGLQLDHGVGHQSVAGKAIETLTLDCEDFPSETDGKESKVEDMEEEEEEEGGDEGGDGKMVSSDLPINEDDKLSNREAVVENGLTQISITSSNMEDNEEKESTSSPHPTSDAVEEHADTRSAREIAGDEIEVIGYDNSTRTFQLPAVETSSPAVGSLSNRGEITEQGFEALISIQFLQNQLLSTESRAQEAEERAGKAELALEHALGRVRALERSLLSTAASPAPSAVDPALVLERSGTFTSTVEKLQQSSSAGGGGRGSSHGTAKEKSHHKAPSKTKSKRK